jgi:uncharacterized damage-inducible protein DinB
MSMQLEMLPASGYSPTVGTVVAMLEQARTSTLDAVAGLDVTALDHQQDARANPIGAILAHVAAIEWAYAVVTLGGTPPTQEEWLEWQPVIQLGPAAWEAARGRPLEFHLRRLRAVRERTLAGLRTVDDAWLSRTITLPWMQRTATNLWAWYHVMEDELNHRGQIRWLRGRLPRVTSPNESPVVERTST